MKNLIPYILLAIFLGTPSETRAAMFKRKIVEPTIIVDISAKRLEFYSGGFKPKLVLPVVTGRGGISNVINSKGTPTGEFTITKEPKHRFGPVFRLSGYQGNNRGILIHKAYGSSTSGCIAPSAPDMAKLFSAVPNGTKLVIRA